MCAQQSKSQLHVINQETLNSFESESVMILCKSNKLFTQSTDVKFIPTSRRHQMLGYV